MSRRKWSLLIGLIGSVVFNVGWWISYPPMVFAGVLLAAAGLDLWIGEMKRRENVDENKRKKSPPEAGTESSAYEGAQGKIFTVTYQDCQKQKCCELI